MSPTWLTALVKARQAQEDKAQYDLASAERRARAAHASTRRASAKVDEMSDLSDRDAMLTAPAFAASAAALQSAAAIHSAAVFAAGQADLAAADRLGALRQAAVERGAAEHLHENAAAAARAEAERIVQREHDETAARVHRDARRATS